LGASEAGFYRVQVGDEALLLHQRRQRDLHLREFRFFESNTVRRSFTR
jgi:hypothetical protein